MQIFPSPVALLLIVLLCGLRPLSSDDAFQKQIAPLINSYCVQCHGPETQEANIRLDDLSTDLITDRAAAETWHEVLNVLGAGEMPPEDEKQLPAEELDKLMQWVRKKIDAAVEATRDTSGRVVLRRLNRIEYQNTMRDLLGIDMDFVRDLPPDAISTDGFNNNGRFLQMSPFHLECYLDSARRALDRVIVVGEAPQVFEHAFEEPKIDGWLGDAEKSMRLQRKQEFLGKMKKDYPEQGEFLIRVTFSALLRENTGFPLLEASLGYRPDTQILLREFDLVEIKSSDEQTLEFKGRLEEFPLPVRGQGKYPGLVVRVRNRYSDGSPLPKKQKEGKRQFFPDEEHLSAIQLQRVEFKGPIFETWPPKLHRQILFDSPLAEEDETEYVRQVLTRFMSRAFRKPVTEEQLQRMMQHYQQIRPVFPSFEETMREVLAMVLIQPSFLYLVEPSEDTRREITDYELASRLSYFLWSTMPDEELMKLAAEATLHKAEVLEGQIDRMLADERSERFTRQFVRQWLHTNGVDAVAVNRDRYKGFDDELKTSMQGETHALFAHLVRENTSALALLDSDYVMINEPLAKHYGFQDVFGQSFRPVPIAAEHHRGGLLGQAGVLLANSTGADSHPVRRAVWIRDRLLNDPPAPPPPDVPSLEEADPKFHELSVREQLEVHRKKDSCNSCHRSIDPWGIALENFDAVGHWREEVSHGKGKKAKKVPVHASDTLPGGTQLEGFAGLKAHLLASHQADFAQAVVSRLLIYALGRRLELSDQAVVDDISNRFMDDEFRLRNLIHHVVKSELFIAK